jgi:hypothetical protein
MDPDGNPLCLYAWQTLLHNALVLHTRSMRSKDGRYTPQDAQHVIDLLTELQSCEELERHKDKLQHDLTALAATPEIDASALQFYAIRRDESIMNTLQDERV